MKCFTVRCPVCGGLNEGLYLEETEGMVECSCCKMTFLAPAYTSRLLEEQMEIKRLPVYTMETVKFLK